MSQLRLLSQNAANGWLRQQTFISHGSGTKEVRDQGVPDSGLGEGLLPELLPCSCAFEWWREKRERALNFPCSYDTKPIMGTPPSRPHLTQITSQSSTSKYHLMGNWSSSI